MIEVITRASGEDDPPARPYVLIRIESEQLMAPQEVDDFIERLRQQLDDTAERARQDLALAIAADRRRNE